METWPRQTHIIIADFIEIGADHLRTHQSHSMAVIILFCTGHLVHSVTGMEKEGNRLFGQPPSFLGNTLRVSNEARRCHNGPTSVGWEG